MKKKIFKFVISLFLLNFSLFAQEKNAKTLSQEAIKKGSPESAIAFLNQQIPNISSATEKRSLYIFLATLQETYSKFDDASKNYAKAAGFSAPNAEGMIKKSNEQLVLDAVRCALSEGDWQTATSYLNSAVRNSKNTEIIAKIKLYEQWAFLCQAESQDELTEPLEILKTYKNLDSMKSVKPSILLTLWYLTQDETFSAELKNEFPNSMECGIVNGKISLLPSPFWYFTPKIQNSENKEKLEKSDAPQKTETSEIKNETKISEKSETVESEQKSEIQKNIKLQLGLFREKSNAQKFADSVTQKGFSPFIIEETKPSGTIYYAVVIDTNGDSELSLKLKTLGFENYQYSE